MGKIGPIKAVLTENSKKIFLTAQDKRNCFCCLMPIFIEQLDIHRKSVILQIDFKKEITEKLVELAEHLDGILSVHRSVVYEHENCTGNDLIRDLKFFREKFIQTVGPCDLTYINYRIKLVINLS